ncbi:STAS-like domain-containing protein [Actibacterium ureilyticum]|uniref:STAS-like domain-containing protein n=1 Tax=Actibacterium ureilyticum TaxID=1590614 RepID=UPI001140CC97|nr:STAS-like domain-containing protein [Actibacterium ureilyticum]
MVVVVKDLVSSCDTNYDGMVVHKHVLSALHGTDSVVVDFSGIPNVTSSFVNCAFVALLQDFDFAQIRSRLHLQNVNRQIGNLVRDRMKKEAATVA